LWHVTQYCFTTAAYCASCAPTEVLGDCGLFARRTVKPADATHIAAATAKTDRFIR
jgi:hypothetical protein